MSVPDFAAPGAILDEGLCAFVAGGTVSRPDPSDPACPDTFVA